MSDDRRWLKPRSPVDARLARLLGAGRSELPSAAQRQALAARLADTWRGPGGGGGGTGGGGGGGAAAPVVSGGALAAAAATLVLGLSGAWWWYAQRSSDETRRSTAIATASALEPAAARDEAELEPAPLASLPLDAGAPLAAVAAVAADAGAARPVRARFARPSPQARPDPAAELQLLDNAQRALAADPAQALRWTERHAQRFAQGQLVQERELIAIEALVRLGRAAQARARAERFLGAYAGSSHAPRVRKLLAAISEHSAQPAVSHQGGR